MKLPSFTNDHLLIFKCYLCGANCHQSPCLSCQNWLTSNATPRCACCGHGLSSEASKCPQETNHEWIDQTFVSTSYGSVIANTVRNFKYNKDSLALPTLQWLALELWETYGSGEALLCMPTHWIRKYRRGFDHIALIAKKLPIDNRQKYFKRRYTKPLEGLSRTQRRSSLRNNIFWHGGRAPTRIMLIDDVTTTGATMQAAARVLKQHGAKEVNALALCKTDH